MDRYQKVEKPKPELPINENEIRITSQGLVRNYISYASTLLQERQGKEIVLKAMGQAISKTVAIAEIIKRRTPRLHQDTAISSVSITDVWEPIEEGLLPVEQTRQVSMITITLSLKELNKNSPGYQAPSNEQQTRPQYNYYQQQQQPPPRQVRAMYNADEEDSYGRGQGRGRGRGRGWSRGGYGNYQENGGYSNWGRGGGRGGLDNGGYSNWGRGGGRRGGRGGPDNGGYSNWGRGSGRGGRDNGGYSNYGQNNGGYSNYGQDNGGYSNYAQDNGGYSNYAQGGNRGGGYGYQGAGYGRGRGGGDGGGRGYSRGGRGRMGPRPRGGGYQA